MDQEKRVLVAFVLSFGLLLLWRQFFVKAPSAPPNGAQRSSAQMSQASKPPQVAPSQPAPSRKKQASAISKRVSLPQEKGEKPQEVAVEGDLYKVTLSSQGAVVKSWVLKKYKDEKGDPLDVVNRPACEQLGFPMDISLPNAELASELKNAVFVVKPSISPLRAPVTVEFSYSNGSIQARKSIIFGSGYEVKVQASVFDGQQYLPLEVAWPGGFGDQTLPAPLREASTRAVYGSPGNFTTVPETKVKEAR